MFATAEPPPDVPNSDPWFIARLRSPLDSLGATLSDAEGSG
jgi:hypothetical protein